MHLLVTGASGWIGSATVRELLAAGHRVTGVARSDTSAAAVTDLGADVVRGDLSDPEGLAAAARGTDGVIHLGYHHDFSQMAEAADLDRSAILAFGDALAGTGAPLVVASGTLGLRPDGVGVETDRPDPAAHPRVANAETALALADRGVRPLVVRFAPTVHGTGDHGFTARLVQVALETGVSAYVGEGRNRWPAVHVLDAARLVRLAVEQAPAGSVLHATAEDGVEARVIAETIGKVLDLPSRSVPAAEAAEHFGWIGGFFAADAPASSDRTRELLGWEPTGPTLVEDLKAGAYAGVTPTPAG